MQKNYLMLVQDLQDRATGAVKAFHGVRIALYGTLAAACLLHRQIMQDEPQLLENAYAAAKIAFKSKNNQQSLYRPFLRLIYKIDHAKGYMANKLADYAAALCELEKEVDSNPDFYNLEGEARLAQYIEQSGGLHALARKHRGEPLPANDDDAQGGTGQGNGGNGGNGGKPTPPANTKQIADAAVELLLDANLAGLGTMNPMCPVAVAENGLVVMIGLRRPDGLFKIVGSTAAKDVIRRAAVEATVNQLGGVPDDLAVLAEVASIAKYPSQALPHSEDKRQGWLTAKFFDVVKNQAANLNDPAALPLTAPRMMVVDTAQNSVRYSGSGIHRGVVVHCRPNVGLSFVGQHLHLSHPDCMRLEGLVDNGVEFLRAVAANDGGLTVCDAVMATDALSGDQHTFAFEPSNMGDSSGSAEFSFDQYQAEWTANMDRSKVQELRNDVLEGYFSSLGKFNQSTRENNRDFELRVSANGIDFAYNFDVTGDPAVDCVAVPVAFEGNTTGANVKLRTKDFATTLYRVACLPLMGDLQVSGNTQAVVLRFSTHLGTFAVAIPTLIANDNCDLGISLFTVKGN